MKEILQAHGGLVVLAVLVCIVSAVSWACDEWAEKKRDK